MARWTLVTTRASASLTAAVKGGGHIDARGREALAGLCGGKEGSDGDNGGREVHFNLIEVLIRISGYDEIFIWILAEMLFSVDEDNEHFFRNDAPFYNFAIVPLP